MMQHLFTSAQGPLKRNYIAALSDTMNGS